MKREPPVLLIPEFNPSWRPCLGVKEITQIGRGGRIMPIPFLRSPGIRILSRLPRKLKKRLGREFGSNSALRVARNTGGLKRRGGPGGYFDREGQPISMYEWLALSNDFDYRIIARDLLPDGDSILSTVWLGLDHGFGSEGPMIFETMDLPHFKHQQRYSSLMEARAGHAYLLAQLWNEGRAEVH